MKAREHSEGYRRLLEFLEGQMAMSHIYQPVMLKTLLVGNGEATRREIAAAFLAKDQSQLEYYDEIVKGYPTQTLKRHGIIEHRRGHYALREIFDDIDADERAILISVCDVKLASFIERRDKMIWKHRSQNFDPVPGSVRWEVIRRAMGRCEACGISAVERALHVDHIIPRSWGGLNDITNYQALCSTCNIQKLNNDASDFHGASEALAQREQGCPFCDPQPSQGVAETALALAMPIPGEEGCFFIFPRRHGAGYFELFQSELNAIRLLELALVEKTKSKGLDCRALSISISSDQSSHCVLRLRFDCSENEKETGIRI